ncbi:MAG: DUF1593 domain-containing protein [Bryobacterales bacterium]|nr:DUF1593 domain-containing protein [Bryobacterales bacterium]
MGSAPYAATTQERPRLIVLTDIGGDPDDHQSLIRLMVFSNEFDIEGLFASASGTPGELKQAAVRPDLIREVVEAYGKVRENLAAHDPRYPSASSLLAVVRAGDPHRRLLSVGEGHDTDASLAIVAAADRIDGRPLNIAIWGGAHDLAQALWHVRKHRSPEALSRFVGKLRVHSIEHQDETGPWITTSFPELFFILSSSNAGVSLENRLPRDRRLSVYRGMYLGGDMSLTSRDWIDANVRTNPLGAIYPMKTWTAPNPHGVMKEGDTPSWFYFLSNGLSNPEHPEWGGWGGRFRHVRDRYYTDAEDNAAPGEGARSTVWRWRPDFQNAFAARMTWCSTHRKDANHEPSAVLNGDATRRVLTLHSKVGARVHLSAKGSSDPDHDSIAYHWYLYPEPGEGSRSAVAIENAATSEASLVIPPETRELHVILEVSDSGSPPLVSYRRAVIRTD